MSHTKMSLRCDIIGPSLALRTCHMCNLGLSRCVVVPILFAFPKGTPCCPLLEGSYWYVALRKTAREHLIIAMAIQTYLKSEAKTRAAAIKNFEKGMVNWGVALPVGVQEVLIQLAETQ